MATLSKSNVLRGEMESRCTLLLVNVAAAVERADEALLPAAYRDIGAALHASPESLGALTLLRSLLQAACFPLAAYVAQHYDRPSVIAVGAALWALATFFVGLSANFLQVAISRALNGVGLAIVVPAIQSIVADSTHQGNRGSAFGWLQLTGNMGSILGGLCSVLLSGRILLGISGWRISFFLGALVSLLVGIMVGVLAVDPRRFQNRDTECSRFASSLWSNTKKMFMEAKNVMQIRTFQVIIAQGVAGSFPWAALAFAPMWLEIVGFSHEMTAVLLGIFIVSGSLGGLFGGYMGDVLSKHLPNSGRIILSQISSGLAVPLAAILLLDLPVDPAAPLLYGITLCVVGFCITWNAPATNNPIFAEIVPQESRASVYALDRSFESVLASFAPPVVGILAQNMYGYVPFPEGDVGHSSADKENAKALAKALYTSIGAPMAICCAVYTLLYWSYPRDRDKALLESGSGGMQKETAVTLELSSKIQEDLFGQSDEEEYPEERSQAPENYEESAYLLSGV